MKVKPLKNYREPLYPTRLEILEDPELLERNLPSGWRKSAEILGLTAILLSMNACIKSGNDNIEKHAVVAPIFEHGEGRGVDGCVVAAPPVFLSEEEAIQVIAEEMAKAGINITDRNVTLNNVSIPIKGKLSEADIEYLKGKVKWEMDILDDDKNIAVEFVSREDYPYILYPRYFSSVQEYNFKKAAKALAKAIRKKEKGIYVGTFYDPVPKSEYEYWKETGKKDWEKRDSKEVAAEFLKEQVKDFVEWLKGQGVI